MICHQLHSLVENFAWMMALGGDGTGLGVGGYLFIFCIYFRLNSYRSTQEKNRLSSQPLCQMGP